jgi:pseudouridine kinase
VLNGSDPVVAARYGQAAAMLTLASPHTVRPDLTPRLIDAALIPAHAEETM